MSARWEAQPNWRRTGQQALLRLGKDCSSSGARPRPSSSRAASPTPPRGSTGAAWASRASCSRGPWRRSATATRRSPRPRQRWSSSALSTSTRPCAARRSRHGSRRPGPPMRRRGRNAERRPDLPRPSRTTTVQTSRAGWRRPSLRATARTQRSGRCCCSTATTWAVTPTAAAWAAGPRCRHDNRPARPAIAGRC